ncbi:MAG: ferrous iron transport protein B [Bacteroidota bacterium]
MSTLLDLRQGETARIIKIKGRGHFRRRLMEMGFVKGKEITVIKSAPLQDPIEYRIMGYHVSLRQSEAQLVEVLTDSEVRHDEEIREIVEHFSGTLQEELLRQTAGEKGKTIEVALVGNPNCGKTTLFNYISRSREHVGNFGGVTVGSKTASFKQKGYRFEITDLPGTYSLSAYSPEELYVRSHVFMELPDILVNVVDASNLERNLFLTTQLIDMDVRVVLALNMYDELTGRGDILDYEGLGKLLGIPVIPTVSSKGKGVRELFDRIIEVYEDRDPVTRHIHINYSQEIERSLARIQDVIWKDQTVTLKASSRYYAIKLLEKDPDVAQILMKSCVYKEILEVVDQEVQRLERIYRDDSTTLIADARFGFIAGALKETLQVDPSEQKQHSRSDLIDRILTNKYFGFPLFLFFLWFMFQTTFSLGEYPKEWIETGVGWISGRVSSLMPPGPLKDLLVDGVINGVGSVIVFLPNILILFFFIAIMEDTGYMARAAFIMDKLMHKMGLHGQSFIPLIMGFGCNVPAIMVTRTLRDRNDRLATMLINPFMSCSARLPVYILITGAIFPDHAGTVIFLIYLTGIVLAILVSLIFKNTLFKSKQAPFVMELPPYRIPTLRVSLRHMWEKGQQYLRKMSGIILVAVILIWALEYFPAGSQASPQQRLEQSYIARIGKFIEPVIQPLGFDWKMGVSLITGAAAKEVVVSTMGVLYGSDHPPEGTSKQNLPLILQNVKYTEGPQLGKPIFTPIAGISYLLFILIYMPCVAVIVTVSRESGSWKWALFLILYTTALAWLLSFTVYQLGNLLF